MKTHNISPILFGNGDELIYVSHLAFKHAFEKTVDGTQVKHWSTALWNIFTAFAFLILYK